MNGIKIKVVDSESDMAIAYAIRSAVFTDEQRIPAAVDIDGKDKNAVNILAWGDSKAIGTGRLYPVNDHLGEIARIAVAEEYRGAGVAKLIIQKLETLARKQGLKELTLWPHERLKAFYESLGFEVMPNQRQVVAGYPLIKMHKIID
ncbi:GNAT family N-acetyltransferase [Fulvivirga lutimaris]|uniref:GNAT family N-acetyltransferase n=1 Tax=Fulvivirga lutimaris TaxID=1819566 RepID=UPI0012BBC264|nr:GNAT family N-acetyltransferase [Fulvivirga lutimaris]MTI39896.1 GNAT family N-acetyltransferase [Fulvivirga lutimaris]